MSFQSFGEHEQIELLSVNTSQGETGAGELVEASIRIHHLLIILVKHAARKRIAKIPVALKICWWLSVLYCFPICFHSWSFRDSACNLVM